MIQVWTDILVSCFDYARHRFWRWWEASLKSPTSRTSHCLCCVKLRFVIGWICHYLLTPQFWFHKLFSAKCFKVRIQIIEKLLLKLKIFHSWKIFLSSYAGLLLPIVCVYQSCLFTHSYTSFSDMPPMSWSCCRCCGIFRPCLGARICRWQCGWATWSYALSFRQFWKISYGSAEPLCR